MKMKAKIAESKNKKHKFKAKIARLKYEKQM